MRLLSFTLTFVSTLVFAQTADESSIKLIFGTALSEGHSYQLLEELTKKIGPRLSGSPGAAAAVNWSRDIMKRYEFDSVWLQPVMVPHWVRGEKEVARFTSKK